MSRSRRAASGAALALGCAAALALGCRAEPTDTAQSDDPRTRAAPPAELAAAADAPRFADARRAAALRSELRRGRLLVVGLDGADWRFLDPEMEAGRLPNLARLATSGARGELVALEPLLSPLLWSSLATGQPPERHGVLDFFEKDARGALRAISSRARRSPAVWDVLSSLGEPVALSGWWATHPAPPLHGVVVSDRVTLTVLPGPRDADLELAVWPPAWRERLRALRLAPEAVPPELVRRLADVGEAEISAAPAAATDDPLRMLVETVAATVTNLRTAEAAWREVSPRALFVYFDGTDVVGHLFAAAAEPALPGVDPQLVRRFAATPRRYWQWLDEELGRLFALAGPDDTIVVVSDHGFRWGADRPRAVESATTTRTAVLWHRPEGMILIAGAGARPGARGRGGTLDFAPTLLALLGLPRGADLPGAPLAWALTAAPPAGEAVDYAALVPVAAPPAAPEASEADREAIARLRALGYLGAESGSAAATDEPLTTGALNNLGARRIATGDLAGAAEAFRRAIRSDPAYPGAYQNLAAVELRLGRAREAVRSFLAGLPHEPGRADEAAVELALALRERGERELAVELLARARELRPPSYTLALNHGTLLGELDRLAEALDAFRAACELGPNSAVAWRNRAVAAAQLGAREEMLAAARRSLELDPDQLELRRLAGL